MLAPDSAEPLVEVRRQLLAVLSLRRCPAAPNSGGVRQSSLLHRQVIRPARLERLEFGACGSGFVGVPIRLNGRAGVLPGR